mgnify:CR=1 FL=1
MIPSRVPGRRGYFNDHALSAARDNPESFQALVAGLSGQKLIDVNGDRVWKKLPRDHYGDTLKQALIVSWISSPMF